MTEIKEEKGKKQPLPGDSNPGNDFFVFDKMSIRRRYPINFVLMGVLGDLCLSRINNEIFDYFTTGQVTPLNRVFMCDILTSPKRDPIKFLKALYEKCEGYNCLESYFTKECIQKVEKSQRINNSHTVSKKSTTKCLGELLTKSGNQIRKGRLGHILADLGLFLFQNYEVSKTSTDLEVLFSGLTDNYNEMDWIFYLGIPPSRYERIIDHIKRYFCDDPRKKINHTSAARVFLLEKPLQDTSEQAITLAGYIKEIEKNPDYPGFHFFAVDHYAAKWTLSQLPALNTIPSFSDFIDNVDEIIIELIEDKDIPDLRLNYMARTGLFFDMMPHILLPLQFLFAVKKLTYEASKINVRYYKGYDQQITKWLEDHKNEKENIRPETYFSLKLLLKVKNADKEKKSQNRTISVFIRSGKEMAIERKRVILKRHEGTRVGTVSIDVKGDKFEPNENSGVSLPPQIRQAEAASKHIRGHARILRDVVDYLSLLPGNSDTSKRISTIVELLSVENAATIIGCIERIEESITDWPKKIEDMKEYEKGTLFIDKKKEKDFRYPFE